MDCAKLGGLIRRLRREKQLTQAALGAMLGVTDRAVSKWETGRGAPDVTLLKALSDALSVNIEGILSGELPQECAVGGNMKRNRWYFCPACGNLVMATGAAEVACCGRRLEPLTAQKPDDAHALSIGDVEDERFITAAHPMTRDHYITFAALIYSGEMKLIKCYPEWDLQLRLPKRHGLLLWHCSRDGLFSKII